MLCLTTQSVPLEEEAIYTVHTCWVYGEPVTTRMIKHCYYLTNLGLCMPLLGEFS